MNKKDYLIAVFYRPPSKSINQFNEQIENWLQTGHVNSKKNLIIMGDMNIDILERNINPQSESYLNILYTAGLQNGIKEPTREELYADHITSSCIDHINSRINPNQIETMIIKTKIADHYMIGFKLNGIGTETSVTDEKIEVISDRLVGNMIRNTNWNDHLTSNDPTKIYDSIVQKFETIYAKATIKIRNKRDGKTQPWITEHIKDRIKMKDVLWNRLKRQPNNNQLKNEYKNHRNNLTNEIRREKRNHYYNKVKDHIGDAKKTWNAVNEILNVRKKPIQSIIRENFKIGKEEDLNKLCNSFNEHFKTKIEEMNRNISTDELYVPTIETDELDLRNEPHTIIRKIQMNKLHSIVKKLNRTASPGIDNIKPKHIRDHFEYLKRILLHLYNIIIETGKIPTKMKTTLLKPIYKNGQKKDIQNYRPIEGQPTPELIRKMVVLMERLTATQTEEAIR
ncbi:uncharacterized protein LOC120354689 [Nilaparvata lugens]|uniref:uncharacterized protein LOC120354689 n=1 Tax=Nilaparvata lugens TaxID=108931 RepID=UPI00193DCF2B|nr:uncharacterized protein LOC120354689 [Nilaparvata lugens]